MKPAYRVILLALIILVFGVAPTVHAIDPDSIVSTPVTCADPPTSWNGEITSADQVDYYSIDLVAGQVLTIDVDAEDLSSSLDSLLEVFDGAGNPIGASDDDKAPGENSVVDPYFELIADAEDTYYLAVSASSKNEGEVAGEEVAGDEGGNTGSYMLFLQCSDPSNPPGPIADVKVGDLLGTTGSESGSLISINPDNGQSSLRFPLGIGPIADIEFDPSSKLVFVAVEAVFAIDDLGAVDAIDTLEYIPARIVAIDPNSGSDVESYSFETESVVALEAAGNELYGVQVDSSGANFTLALVTFDADQKTAKLTDVVSLGSVDVRALAYNQSEKVLYGASGADLITFDLTSSPVKIQKVGSPGLGEIVALDFSHEDVLYGVARSGHIFNVTDLSSGQAVAIGDPIAEVSGLTFVVGEAPPDEEPIKTLCSSTLTSPMTASSETNRPKLSRLKLKNNPVHRAIGLFKFKGRAGETVTLKLAPEVEEAVEAGEEYAVSALLEPWLKCRGKGRVFLGIRDAIPNVDFRARKKDQMPFDMSADLPEDGYYYVMVIRPLLRFYKSDYCLTLESDHPDSEAWQTLDVVWPDDDSEEDTATTSTEAKTAEVQSDEVYDEGSSGSEDTTPGETPGVVPTLTGSEPVSVTPDSIKPELVVEEGTGQEVQAVEETTVDDTGEVAPAEEPAAEATEEFTVKGAPLIPEETTVDDTGEVAAEEPAAEATEEFTVKGACLIPEETTVDDTGEIAPEEPADEISGDSESADGSGSAEVADDDSDGAESPEGDTSDVVEEEPTG